MHSLIADYAVWVGAHDPYEFIECKRVAGRDAYLPREYSYGRY